MSMKIAGMIKRVENNIGPLCPYAKAYLHGVATCIEKNHPEYLVSFIHPRRMTVPSIGVTGCGISFLWMGGCTLLIPSKESVIKIPPYFRLPTYTENGRIVPGKMTFFPTSKDIAPFMEKTCDLKS